MYTQKQEDAAKKIQKAWRGHAVRRQVQVKRVEPNTNIVHTKIHRPETGDFITDKSGSASEIMNLMKKGATYNRLRVAGGSQSMGIFGTSEGQEPQDPGELASTVPSQTAVINGGYFVHKSGLETDQGEKIAKKGLPVGPTSTRTDYTPVPEPWKQDYGKVTMDEKVGLSSGPLLALNGEQHNVTNDNNDNRFNYKVSGSENSLNKRAGALTHSSDPNERAAISINKDNVIMHTLTSKGKRNLGANMQEWQKITEAGANETTEAGAKKSSTLNLDGGGSVFMGIRGLDNKFTRIARGGDPGQNVRPVANIIASHPKNKGLPENKILDKHGEILRQ